jgi:hypothetical protein
VSLTSLRARVEHWLSDRPDDCVLRWLLRVMIAATVTVLALDYAQLQARVEQQASIPLPAPTAAPEIDPDITRTITEVLPSFRRADKRGLPQRSDERLRAAMSFELVADGRLIAVGTIRPGTAKTFAAEIDKRGGYVKTVVLHSPGGSVGDALEMGRLIRQNKFSTEVENGGYCASSCPLVFAGGVERRAGATAAIGVHQVTTFAVNGATPTLDKGMDSVQRISAECQKYLLEMGIDPLVWVHAMETPKDELFYFKPDELMKLKLATQKADASKPAGVPPARAKS